MNDQASDLIRKSGYACPAPDLNFSNNCGGRSIMFRWLVGSSLKFRFIVIAVAIVMMYFGISTIRHDAPVDVFPEFAPPLVEIQTPCLGLSSTEVESLVTVPLEQSLIGVADLDIIRSKSVPQLSSIKLIFEPDTDLLNARQLVQERIAMVTPMLPSWATPPVILQPLSATSRCLKIGISSEEFSLIELSMIAHWKIRPRLMSVRGVANVAMWGERKEMLHVLADPQRLRENRVTLEKILEVSGDALDAGLLQYTSGTMVGTGGFIDTPNQRIGIRHLMPIVSPEDLSKVSFEGQDGKVVRLGDVTEVVEGHQPLIGDGIINDGPGLLLIVEKFPWANTLQVTRSVEEALGALSPGLKEVEIDSKIFRPATFIEMAINNLTKALVIGCVLVILVLFAFLYEWRVAVISCVAIPLSLTAGMIVLYLFGTIINTMVLAGFVIALGAVVDDAIIDVENIARRLRMHPNKGGGRSIATVARVILEASIEVRSAIVYATLIEVIALLPVFFMKGLSGAFFQPLAFSYALAVLASMLVALTVTPAMSLLLLRNAPIEKRSSPLIGWLQRGYDWFLSRIIPNPRWAYIAVGIIFLAGALVLPRLGHSLLPDFKERDFLMHWLTKPGTSHPEMVRITIQGSKELRSIPGVKNFGAHIGQAMYMDEVVGMYFGENWISVDPAVDYDETRDAIQAVVDGYPGLFRDVLTYLKERIREVLTGTSESVVVRIYGNDLRILRKKAKEVKTALSDIEGIIDLHVGLQTFVPTVEIEVDLTAAKPHGLKPGDVRRAVAAYLASIEVSDRYADGQIFDVRIWGTEENRHSLTSIENLLIDTPTGGTVRLADVADVRLVPTPNYIKREGLARRLDVGANIRGRDLGSVVADVERALKTVEFPLGYHPELLGEYAERQSVQKRMVGFVIVAVFGILFLLKSSFGVWRLSVLAFLTLPSALVGGVLAAYLGSGIISLGSIVGFLTILGIAARNGIMMINHFQHLEQHEGMTFGFDLVLRGARERLAPI
jgi:CzcA family heavy metal efflux pump